MTTNVNYRLRLFLLSAAGMLLSSLAYAQDALPKAEALIDKAFEASGGKAAHQKLNSRVIKGTLEIPAMGLRGELAIYHMRPNLMYTLVEIPDVTKQQRGFDGKVGWEIETTQGPRLMEGEELKELTLDADFDSDLKWRERYPKVETVALEDVNGKPAYKVELTDSEKKKTVNYYDKDTNLLVRSDSIYDSPMGSLPVESYFEDFRKVGDFTIAHRQRILVTNSERIITYTSIENNAKIEKDRFALPDEIKALVKDQKAEEKTESKTDQP